MNVTIHIVHKKKLTQFKSPEIIVQDITKIDSLDCRHLFSLLPN